MDCRGAGAGYSVCCNFAVHKYGSDGTSVEKGGWCTAGAVHPVIVQTSFPSMAPGQGRVDEQIHSRVQRCGERSGGLVDQTRGTAGVDIHRTCNDGCLT